MGVRLLQHISPAMTSSIIHQITIVSHLVLMMLTEWSTSSCRDQREHNQVALLNGQLMGSMVWR